jgi:hypothetical protein
MGAACEAQIVIESVIYYDETDRLEIRFRSDGETQDADLIASE